MSNNVSLTARLLRGNVLTDACSRVRGALALASIMPKTSMTNIQHNSTQATFDVKPYKLWKLDKGPSQKVTITSDQAIKYYKELQMCRRIEAAAAGLYKEKVIRGFCHLYTDKFQPLQLGYGSRGGCEAAVHALATYLNSGKGQEAIAVGIKSVIRPHDSLITAYRCHAFTYIMDGTVLGVIAELTGRKSGNARGKGGSMHMYGKNYYGGNGIVGSQVPLGTGVGFAHKYKGDGGITFSLYGDGAANQGQLFEAFNMAKLWGLPVIYICENNKYGLGTAAKRASACTDYYMRGQYIPGIWVDGMDVLACSEATRYAIEWVTAGKGPILMEMETYRYHGHSMSDPGTSYRTREEVQQVRQARDPLNSFKEKILNKKLVNNEKIKEIEASVRKHVDEAAKQAVTEPEIGVEELTADIYVDSITSHIRGVLPDKPLPHLKVAKRN